MSGEELLSNFKNVQRQFVNLSSEGTRDTADISAAISLSQKCIRDRDIMGLFSANEEMEDFSTKIIQYLFLEYYMAKFCMQYQSLERRQYYLQTAKSAFEAYLERCCSLRGLLHSEEVAQCANLFPNSIRMKRIGGNAVEKEERRGFVGEDEDSNGAKLASDAVISGRALSMKHVTPNVLSATPEQQRNYKIARFKREKETQKRIQYLQGQLAKGMTAKVRSSSLRDIQANLESTQLSSAAGDSETFVKPMTAEKENEENDENEEEELRELYILQMQSYARDALDDVPLLEQELVMLAMMTSMRHEHQKGPAQQYEVESDRFNNKNDPNGQARANLAFLPSLPPLDPSQHQGIEVTHTSLGANGQIVLDRETIRANVFVPRMQGPTMSLEEFADQEKAAAMERSRVQAEHAVSSKGADTENESRRYAQLEADGDEDVMRLVDAATLKDREWDAWKEHNPKGWGNKAGKRF